MKYIREDIIHMHNDYIEMILEKSKEKKKQDKIKIIKKFADVPEIYNWAVEKDLKLSIWLANALKDLILSSFVDIENTDEVIKNFKLFLKGEKYDKKYDKMQILGGVLNPSFKDYIKEMIEDFEPEFKTILDWINSPIREEKINLNQLSFDDAAKQAVDWHDELDASGIVVNETGTVILQYPDGWYWIDLETTNCEDEANAMGHCGITSEGDTLLSLRKNKSPHVTVALEGSLNNELFEDTDESWITQIKGRNNKKPVKKYHKYIVDLLLKLDIKGFRLEHDTGDDFDVSDLNQELFDKLLLKKPNLLHPVHSDIDKIYKLVKKKLNFFDNYNAIASDKNILQYRLAFNYFDDEQITNLVKDIEYDGGVGELRFVDNKFKYTSYEKIKFCDIQVPIKYNEQEENNDLNSVTLNMKTLFMFNKAFDKLYDNENYNILDLGNEDNKSFDYFHYILNNDNLNIFKGSLGLPAGTGMKGPRDILTKIIEDYNNIFKSKVKEEYESILIFLKENKVVLKDNDTIILDLDFFKDFKFNRGIFYYIMSYISNDIPRISGDYKIKYRLTEDFNEFFKKEIYPYQLPENRKRPNNESLITESKENKKQKQINKIKKFADVPEIYNWAVEKDLKLSVWLANTLKNLILEYIDDSYIASDVDTITKNFKRALKGETIKSLALLEDFGVEDLIDDVLYERDPYDDEIPTPDTAFQTIIDWFNSPLREEKINLKELDFADAYEKAKIWHDELKAGGIIEDETGEIIKTYDDGYYWIDLQTTSCSAEGESMGHCGRTNDGTTLVSLRKNKSPHVTVALQQYDDLDGYDYDEERHFIITQMKGRNNKKPIEKYHKYIVDLLLTYEDINGFNLEYDTGDDFLIDDLNDEDYLKIIKHNSNLIYSYRFNTDKLYNAIKKDNSILDSFIENNNVSDKEITKVIFKLVSEHPNKLIIDKMIKHNIKYNDSQGYLSIKDNKYHYDFKADIEFRNLLEILDIRYDYNKLEGKFAWKNIPISKITSKFFIRFFYLIIIGDKIEYDFFFPNFIEELLRSVGPNYKDVIDFDYSNVDLNKFIPTLIKKMSIEFKSFENWLNDNKINCKDNDYSNTNEPCTLILDLDFFKGKEVFKGWRKDVFEVIKKYFLSLQNEENIFYKIKYDIITDLNKFYEL